jgi:hypothetical protein
MRNADLAADRSPTGSDLGFHTLLLVTHLGDVALASLVADADAVASICTPAEADAILRHVAVEMVMVLDDVAPADRFRIQTRAGAATFVFGAPTSPEHAPAPERVTRARLTLAA